MTSSVKQQRLVQQERTLKRVPTNEEIDAALSQLPESWQTVVARMALLGLRPHECWLGCWNDNGTYTVLTGKTGRRIAISFELRDRPEWVRMAMGPLPMVTAHENRDYGSRLNKVFCRAGISGPGGWSPYCLRHRWVALSARLNTLDESVAAAAAGHSVATRKKTYKSLLDESHVLGAAEQNGYTFDLTQFLNSKDI